MDLKARGEPAAAKVFLDTNLWLGLVNPYDEWNNCARRLEAVLKKAGIKPLVLYVVQGETRSMLRRQMRRWYLRCRDGKPEGEGPNILASNRGRLFSRLCREGHLGETGLAIARCEKLRGEATGIEDMTLEIDTLVDRLIVSPQIDISVRFMPLPKIRPELQQILKAARELMLETWAEAGIVEGSKHENDWRILQDILLSLSPEKNLFMTGDRPHAARLQKVVRKLELELPSQRLDVRLIRRGGVAKPKECASCNGDITEHWRCRDCRADAQWLHEYLGT